MNITIWGITRKTTVILNSINKVISSGNIFWKTQIRKMVKPKTQIRRNISTQNQPRPEQLELSRPRQVRMWETTAAAAIQEDLFYTKNFPQL